MTQYFREAFLILVETKNASETCNLLNSCKDLVDCSTQSDSLPDIAKVTQGSQTTAPVRNQSDQNVQTLSGKL